MAPLPLLDVFPSVLLAQTAGAWPYYWHLPILLVIISLVYSATRFDDWPMILHEAIRWGVRLFIFLLVIAVILYGLASII